MTHRAVPVGWALFAALLAGCGSDANVQGGGATETDNSVHILATSADGSPLAGARVLLVRTDTWLRDVATTGSPTTISRTTDPQGRLRIAALPDGEWSAQLDTLSQGADIPLGRDTATRILKLQPMSRLDIGLGGSAGAHLLAVGTAWGATTDSVGRATLFLPPGRRSLVSAKDSDLAPLAAVTVSVGSSLDTTLPAPPRRLVLDDFASGNGRTTLSDYTGLGRWFVNAWGTQIYSDADPQGASFAGALSLRYIAPDTANAVLAGIVFGDAGGFRSMDFSRMDSICFDIRANGQVELFFIEYAADRSWKLSANAPVPVASGTWTRRCLAAGSMQDNWPLVKTTANTIAFLAKRGDLLEVRAMELWGVRLQDMSR